MASYVVISGTDQGVGHHHIVAIAVDDGQRMMAVGEGGVADDILDIANELEPGDPIERLRSALHGLNYYDLDGPHEYDGTTKEAYGPIGRIYGLL